ncbi:MAG: type III pantothenate kinase [Gammaproteobacteria bacterium]|nr:type III pantothenate kinase [Gammaproteobacteria bacterium]TVQ46388.1 MAG: type III pantothenate kinase [Gammaproteobacteria bacterium]
MKLLVDAGNSRLKWALWDGQRLSSPGRCPARSDPAGAVRALVSAAPEQLDGVLVANVAGPWMADALRRGLARACARPPVFVASTATALGVRCAYANPARLGVDRWVAVIAAFHHVAGAALVVDAGTAVTIDAVAADGRHLGGLILAGRELMARALYRDTSDIGRAHLQALPGEAEAAFGRSTDEAVSFGAAWALVGAVERARSAAAGALGERPPLLVTGGGAPELLPYLDGAVEHRPQLLLEGLARFAGEHA